MCSALANPLEKRSPKPDEMRSSQPSSNCANDVNRGTVLAQAVSVTLWLMDWPKGQIPPGPDWQRAVWQGVAHNQLIDIPPGDTRQFGPIPLPAAAGRRLVLAQANCADDRAIIDPILGLSCVGHRTALSQLVPGDNNLGLAILGP